MLANRRTGSGLALRPQACVSRPKPRHQGLRQRLETRQHTLKSEGCYSSSKYMLDRVETASGILGRVRLSLALLCSIASLSGADFAGSQACARCHLAISRAYART